MPWPTERALNKEFLMKSWPVSVVSCLLEPNRELIGVLHLKGTLGARLLINGRSRTQTISPRLGPTCLRLTAYYGCRVPAESRN